MYVLIRKVEKLKRMYVFVDFGCRSLALSRSRAPSLNLMSFGWNCHHSFFTSSRGTQRLIFQKDHGPPLQLLLTPKISEEVITSASPLPILIHLFRPSRYIPSLSWSITVYCHVNSISTVQVPQWWDLKGFVDIIVIFGFMWFFMYYCASTKL